MIEKMTKAEIDKIADLEVEIFSDAWSCKSIETTIEQARNICLVAKVQGEIAGYFLGTQLFEEAEVYRIAVAPSYRRQNVGAALMEAFLAEARQRGANEFRLEVRENNEAARALYERFGFQIEGRRKDYYQAPKEDAILYVRIDGNGSPMEFVEA